LASLLPTLTHSSITHTCDTRHNNTISYYS
jgi:hypothetical protein